MLSGAFDQQARSRATLKEGNTQAALKLTRMARDSAERARRFCLSRSGAEALPEYVELELSRTDGILNRSEEFLPEGGPEESLRNARRIQTAAWEHFRSERFPQALHMTRQARKLIARNLGQVDVKLESERVARMIESTSDLLESLSDDAASEGDDRTQALLDRAEKLLQEARESLDLGEVGPAFGLVRAASALLLDVAERLGH
jgi:hypothetical protein